MTTTRNRSPRRHHAIHNQQCLTSTSTGIDTIRQDTAERNENSCAHAREAFSPTSFPLPVYVIPTPCLRHSRTLPTSFPHYSRHSHTTPVIPAKAGIPVPAAYWGPIALICRPRVRHRPTNRTHEETRLRFGTDRDTLIDSVRCRAPRRLANECRTAHPRTMLLKRPCA